MSISKCLIAEEYRELVRRSSWKFGRPQVMEIGLRYFEEHPEEVSQIASNLRYMGLSDSGSDLNAVLEGIVAHYYEKLFVLVKTYETYWIAKNRIDIGDSLEPFREARETGKAVFIGQAHFGATYLMAGALAVHGLDQHVVGYFPEPVGGMLQESGRVLSERYQAGHTRVLNLAHAEVDVPLEMMQLLSRKKILSNVYDENNKFCKRVTLLGKPLMGGTGMDLILRNFSDEKVIVVTPFLVRTSDETFRYELDRHRLADGDIIASAFRSLERRVREHPEQWYFIRELHESFPRSEVQ